MAAARRGILELTLQTRDVPALRQFYTQTLGLRLVRDVRDTITIAAGGTTLTFVETKTGRPIYHFAFNIPENKLDAARVWLGSRVAIHRDPDGNEVYDFASWNAHAVYFFDPAGNILEFIARHSLKNASPGAFTSADILYASEIGIVVDNIAAAVAAAKRGWGLQIFNRTQSHDFAAVGTDEGLLIIAKRGRPWSGSDGAAADVFETHAVFSGDRNAVMKLPGMPYSLEMTAF